MSWLGLLMGCLLCGTYEVSNTSATNNDGDDYNGTWRESCGEGRGTWGSWDLYGDDTIEIYFAPDRKGDDTWDAIDLSVSAVVPIENWEVGRTLEVGEFGGSAHINPGATLVEDPAGLTEGTLTIVSGWEGDDVCAVEDGPVFKLQWDMVYGGDDGPTYVVDGSDSVRLGTFQSESCPD